MNNKIEKLPESINKNGFVYKLIERTDKAAIYEQYEKDGTSTRHWEVFQIKRHDPRRKAKMICEKKGEVFVPENYSELKEAFPGDEAFGKTAWCFMNLYMAIDKYNSIRE